MSQDSPPEADFLEKRTVNGGKTVMDGVHQHVALHAGQDLFYVRWRLVVGIGPEFQFDQSLASPANTFRALFFSGVPEEEGVGQCAHDAESTLGFRALLVTLLF